MGDWLSDLQSALRQIGDNLQKWFSNIWGLLTASANALITAYTALSSAIYNGITEFGSWIQQGLTGLGDKLGSYINTAYQWLQKGLEALGNWIQSGLSALGDLLRSGLDALGGWLKSALDWIAENLFKFGQWLWNGLEGAGAWIKAGIDWVAENLFKFGQWLWNGLCGLGSWIKSGIDWIGTQLYNFGQWLWNGLQWIGGVIWQGIKGVVGFFANIFNTILDHIKGWWESTVDYLNQWWTGVVVSLRRKIKQMIMTNVSIVGSWKSFERLLQARSSRDVGLCLLGIVGSPIVGALCSEVVDAVVPLPNANATFELIPKASVYGSAGLQTKFTEPNEPTKPTIGERYTAEFTPEKPELGERYSSQFTEDKPELTSPYEPSTAYPTATGGAKTMIVDATPQRVGALGTRIKSVTIKAPINNTSRIWIGFEEDMTPDNVFKLVPGEAIDIAIDDLGKLWIRAEEGTQEVSVIWIKL